jgi:hypothetical protein
VAFSVHSQVIYVQRQCHPLYMPLFDINDFVVYGACHCFDINEFVVYGECHSFDVNDLVIHRESHSL